MAFTSEVSRPHEYYKTLKIKMDGKKYADLSYVSLENKFESSKIRFPIIKLLVVFIKLELSF